MSTKNSNTTDLASEAEQATKARESAEAAKVAADAAYDQAQAAQADVEKRLATTGDVTQDQYDGAVFATRKAAGTQWLAGEELEQAIIAEQLTVAVAASAELIDGSASRENADKAVASASSTVARAVTKLVESIEHRNGVIRSAIGEAKAANLVSGKADPFSPVLVATERNPLRRFGPGKGGEVLLVNGEPARVEYPEGIVQKALTTALAAAGLDLVVTKAGGR